MANPFDIANFNLVNFAQVLPDILDSEPKDVPYVFKDANGNIVTKTITNRGKFKKQIWDDVGGALGQFNRIFYVDAVNGDDNNDGSSSSPFKTIKKACDSVPIGGYGQIRLFTSCEITNDILLKNKNILIIADNIYTEITVSNISTYDNDTYGCKTNGFILDNSVLYLRYLTVRTANFPNDGVDYSVKPNYYTGIIKRVDMQSNNLVVCGNVTIFLGDTPFARMSNRQNSDFIFYHRNLNFYDFSIKCVGANVNSALIQNENGTIRFDANTFTLDTKNDGTTQLSWTDLVWGVVRDANGIPRNIVSNIIL